VAESNTVRAITPVPTPMVLHGGRRERKRRRLLRAAHAGREGDGCSASAQERDVRGFDPLGQALAMAPLGVVARVPELYNL